jgi:Reverse transcriptase (RNA-dependent DNA polymerase)
MYIDVPYALWNNLRPLSKLSQLTHPFAHHTRLIHNMRQRRIPEAISQWINSFLQGRSTQLQFNGTKSKSTPTPAGVPQGSPLSPLLYMYYNADSLEMASQYEGTRLGFIDDIAYGIYGNSGKGRMKTGILLGDPTKIKCPMAYINETGRLTS